MILEHFHGTNLLPPLPPVFPPRTRSFVFTFQRACGATDSAPGFYQVLRCISASPIQADCKSWFRANAAVFPEGAGPSSPRTVCNTDGVCVEPFQPLAVYDLDSPPDPASVPANGTSPQVSDNGN